MKQPILIATALFLFLVSCKKEVVTDVGPQLIFKFKFDSTQTRLNNIAQPDTIPPTNAGQSPIFNKMSAHYIELSPAATTALGGGTVLYKAPETTAGGSNAIDFDKSTFAGNGETFFTIPLSKVKAGDYQWLRVSLAYQNYEVKFFVDTVVNGIAIQKEFPATVASFIGFNTYIKNYTIKNQSVTVNGNKQQGYWGFETYVSQNGLTFPFSATGQAPAGATTVVNPLFATSPIPQGSCVVTAAFTPGKLTITGNETKSIIVEVSLSTNKSFEWVEVNADGKWQPNRGEQVVNMGIRGMIPKIQ
jgi:hypothetical protein